MQLQKAQEKDLCKTSSIIKSRGFTILLPRVEIDGVVSPKTEGVLITPGIGITSPFLFSVGLREISTPFPLRRENEFPIPPTSQIPFINSSPLYVSSSLFALQKLARSPLPSQMDTHVIKCLHHKTHLHNLIFPAISPGISIPFCLIFPEIPTLFSYSTYPPASP